MGDIINDYSNIHEKVAMFVQGKYGRIGIIVPDRKPTRAEWEDLHVTLAEIAVRNAMRAAEEMKETQEAEAAT